MRPLTVAALIALAAAAAAPAFAAPQPIHLNDVQFVEANRCLGLMTSKSLGTQDASAMAQVVKTQTIGRINYIYDRADQARDDAKRQADHAGPDNSRLIAERDGLCRSFIGSGSTEASGEHAASQMLR